ncbi:hypothetical protein LTR56_003008 [Elasticomyces elasticus]|nr:hypothetical protein LTR56_003008 [Elasticomyces elasticus]KAK3662071.1 hypothetical protein LTR22_007043 [Elasticomyces elasticus]KAK4927567.1 hypothetical protein LTR49_005708 [Elasticomyces elasticus]KAK5753220.1 hypothetical protein LTS12_016687 [Elasticomyces elasticus]
MLDTAADPAEEHLIKPMGQHNGPMSASEMLSHSMSSSDPFNPMNWPLHRKIYTSFCAWLFAAAVAFGATCFTAGKADFIQDFNIGDGVPVSFVAGLSLYLWGITFAPIWTPHVADRTGRSLIYLIGLPVSGLFVLGAGLSPSLGGVLACRFFAGLTGGPCLVLIEGTFADIWSAKTTNTYYAFLGTAQYFGASLGPLAGGYLIKATDNWRWTQYFNCILIAIVFLFGLGQSETYQREIPRRRARYSGMSRKDFIRTQDPALSGESLGEMLRITVLDAIVGPFTDPVIALSTLFLVFNFAVVFQWFISVPAALGAPPPMGPGYTIDRIGLAIGLTGTVGSTCAALMSITIEQVSSGMLMKSTKIVPATAIEYRLVPAMIGQFLITTSLFWIGWTVSPDFSPIVPIIGTAVYIFGNASIIISIIPYLFDAFPPAGTLTALTSAASGRILFAGFLPMVILYDITALTPKWAFGTFGFISIAMWSIPFLLFRYGATWRAKSRYSKASMAMHDGEAIHRKLPGRDSVTTHDSSATET